MSAFQKIDRWTDGATVASDRSGTRTVTTGSRPHWATRWRDAGPYGIELAGDPVPVDLQVDDQLPATVELARKTVVDWRPGVVDVFDHSPIIRVTGADDGAVIVELSVPGARALAGILLRLADDAGPVESGAR